MCCISCCIGFFKWMKSKQKNIPLAVPMLWQEPSNHVNYCYFWTTYVAKYSKKDKNKITPSPMEKTILYQVQHPLHRLQFLVQRKLTPTSDAYLNIRGERFHEDARILEIRFQGWFDLVMMADFCCFLKRRFNVTQKEKKRY